MRLPTTSTMRSSGFLKQRMRAFRYLLGLKVMPLSYSRSCSAWMCQSISSPIKLPHTILSHIYLLALMFTQPLKWRKITQKISLNAHKHRWPNMLKRWLALWIKAQRFLITVIQSAMKPAKVAIHGLLPFQALFLPISARSSAKEKDPFVG